MTTWSLGSGPTQQQVGTVWSGDSDIVSLSGSGDLNIFDRRTGDKPVTVLQVLSSSPKSTPALILRIRRVLKRL